MPFSGVVPWVTLKFWTLATFRSNEANFGKISVDMARKIQTS